MPVYFLSKKGTPQAQYPYVWVSSTSSDFAQAVNDTISDTPLLATNGTVSLPAYSFASNPDTGMYVVSGTQIGWTMNGTLVAGFNGTGLFTSVISEQVAASGVTIDGMLIKDSGADLNGVGTLVFDADGDTYMSATSDDIIDIFTVGAANFWSFDGTTGTFRVKAGYIGATTTDVVYIDEASGVNVTTEAISVAAAGTVASIAGKVMQAQVTITGLAAAAGAAESQTVTGLTWLFTTSTIKATIASYSGTWVTNGIPLVTAATCGVNGTLTLSVTNIHGANALSGNLVVNVEWV